MSEGYYSRASTRNSDGTPIFATGEDKAEQDRIASVVAERWGCELREFGALALIDFYVLRHGRLVGLAEVKRRSHARDKYPTVFLNLRKWLALVLGSLGLGVRSFFVVGFDDGIGWIDVGEVDASRLRIGGCAERVKSCSDVEPVIEVPVGRLRWIRQQEEP